MALRSRLASEEADEKGYTAKNARLLRSSPAQPKDVIIAGLAAAADVCVGPDIEAGRQAYDEVDGKIGSEPQVHVWFTEYACLSF